MSEGLPNGADELPPVDTDALNVEMTDGLNRVAEVPLSQTTLAALAFASQYALHREDCPVPIKALLAEFVQGCQQSAGFGPQTTLLLAWQGRGLAAETKPIIIVPGGRG